MGLHTQTHVCVYIMYAMQCHESWCTAQLRLICSEWPSKNKSGEPKATSVTKMISNDKVVSIWLRRFKLNIKIWYCGNHQLYGSLLFAFISQLVNDKDGDRVICFCNRTFLFFFSLPSLRYSVDILDFGLSVHVEYYFRLSSLLLLLLFVFRRSCCFSSLRSFTHSQKVVS